MDTIRHLAPADLPSVARLFQRVFRKLPESAPLSLQSYLQEIYLDIPWYEKDLSPLVVESGGRIVGFVGTYPLPFLLHGSRIMAVLAGNLMIDPDHRNPFTAGRLLKQLFSGPQDATLTDTATGVARRLWEGLGSATIMLPSLQWLRPLRPGRFLLSLARRYSPRFAAIEVLGKPVSLCTDYLLRQIPGSPFRNPVSTLRQEELSPALLLDGLRTIVPARRLQPDYDLESLNWLICRAAEKREFGKLRSIALYNDRDSLAGWVLYYPNPGRPGQVLQCVAAPGAAAEVLRNLVADATGQGSTALIGRCDPHMIPEMSELGFLFTNRGSFVQVHSRREDLIRALHSGDAFFTRLEGEWWTRLQGDIFE